MDASEENSNDYSMETTKRKLELLVTKLHGCGFRFRAYNEGDKRPLRILPALQRACHAARIYETGRDDEYIIYLGLIPDKVILVDHEIDLTLKLQDELTKNGKVMILDDHGILPQPPKDVPKYSDLNEIVKMRICGYNVSRMSILGPEGFSNEVGSLDEAFATIEHFINKQDPIEKKKKKKK